MEKRTSDFLITLGFYPHQLGFAYLVFAITAVASDPVGYYARTTDIFRLLYNTFSVSHSKALRCMNYSIVCAWNNAGNGMRKRLFPQSNGNFPPPVSEFICRSALAVRYADENEFSGSEPCAM